MDENPDARQAIFEPPPENWRRPPGRPHTNWVKNIHDDLSSLDLGIYETRNLVQTEVFAQHYALEIGSSRLKGCEGNCEPGGK